METYYDEYNRGVCFVDLDREDQREVVKEYVAETMKHGDVPSFNNFVAEGVQQTLAKRHAATMATA